VKVLHVLRTGGNAYGVERAVLAMVPALMRRGSEVRVLVVAETRAGGMTASTAELLGQSGCAFEVLETARRLPFGVARKLRRTCRAEEPDVVHSHGYKCDVALILSRTKAAKVSTIHGWCSRSLKEKLYEWIGVQCQKRMDAVIALCEDYRRRLRRRGTPSDRIHVAPVGVDPAALCSTGRNLRREWGVGPEEVLIAQVGRLSCEKNPQLFVEVARALHPQLPQARFALVGDGPLTAYCQSLVADAGVPVLLPGYVKETGDVHRALDIVVNCSTTEGLPGALLEAGATGRPVVATAVGGVPEIVEDGVTGVLCASGDGRAIASAVARLAGDGELRERMGAAARERVVARFNTDRCSERLIEVYERVLTGERSASALGRT